MNGERFGSVSDRPARRGIPFSGRLIFGAVVLTLGVLWTLDNLNLMDADDVLRWWPVLLAWFGIVRIFGIFGPRSVMSGSLFLTIGLWMLLRELGVINVSIFKLWPVFLIVVGAALVWRSLHGAPEPEGTDRDAHPRPFAMMGGVVRSIESQELTAIEATAIMGGVELDLRGAKARGREVVVEVFAWWGGIELYVPEDWRVVTEATPLMGGVDDQTRVEVAEPVTTLIVRGMVIMGGIEIRNSRRKEGDKGSRSGVFVAWEAGTGGGKRTDATGASAPRDERSKD